MQVASFRKLTMIEQTLFSLPFVLASCWLAIGATQRFPSIFELIALLAAVVSARTSGMAFNRLIDKDIDAINPRTANRPLCTGEISVRETRITAWLSLALFIAVCRVGNDKVFALSFVAAGLIYGYSYMKRFSSLCHLVLGGVHFFAPFLAYVAISNAFEPSAFWLGMMALSHVMSMDIIYSCQDRTHDASHGLHSIPVRLGTQGALILAACLHIVTVACMAFVGQALNLSILYQAGLIAMAALFAYEHSLVRPGNLTQVHTAFFKCNVVASGLFLAMALVG